jgi:hypothetical protein
MIRKGLYLVFFTDYGNYDEVDVRDMKKMPEKYNSIEPQC